MFYGIYIINFIKKREFYHKRSLSQKVYFFVRGNSQSYLSPENERILQKGIEISGDVCYTDVVSFGTVIYKKVHFPVKLPLLQQFSIFVNFRPVTERR